MDILGVINKATELVNQGIGIFEGLTGEVKDASQAIAETDLEQAKQRLAASLQRANTAHDSLKAAIEQRLASSGQSAARGEGGVGTRTDQQ